MRLQGNTTVTDEGGTCAGDCKFLIAAGLTQRVDARLTARALNALVRAKRLPTEVLIRYEQPTGTITTATRMITLSAPKPARR